MVALHSAATSTVFRARVSTPDYSVEAVPSYSRESRQQEQHLLKAASGKAELGSNQLF
jgi:hypothetical protein